MTELTFRITTVEQAHAKVEAFTRLFDVPPQVAIRGEFIDERGGLYRFSVPKRVDRVGTNWIEIEFHTRAAWIRPYGASQLMLSDPNSAHA